MSDAPLQMFWDTSHVDSNEKFDARLIEYPGWENTAGWISTRDMATPADLAFTADFSVIRNTDYPFNNVNWPLMSRRMLEVLRSVADFPHRAIPVPLIDETVRPSDRADDAGQVHPEVVDDRFVLVQLTEHLNAFDWERSEYERSRINQNRLRIVSRLVLKETSEPYPPLFRLSAKPAYLFVSGEARQRLEQEAVRGMVFWTLDQITA